MSTAYNASDLGRLFGASSQPIGSQVHLLAQHRDSSSFMVLYVPGLAVLWGHAIAAKLCLASAHTASDMGDRRGWELDLSR